MSATGDLEIKFSKKMLKPPLKITAKNEEKDASTRLLEYSTVGEIFYDI